jgi:hypothetical protein
LHMARGPSGVLEMYVSAAGGGVKQAVVAGCCGLQDSWLAAVAWHHYSLSRCWYDACHARTTAVRCLAIVAAVVLSVPGLTCMSIAVVYKLESPCS